MLGKPPTEMNAHAAAHNHSAERLNMLVQPFWRNPYILATAFKQCLFLIYLFATDGEQFSYEFCGIVEVPGELRIRLLCLVGAQIVLAFSLEKFAAASLMQQPSTRAC